MRKPPTFVILIKFCGPTNPGAMIVDRLRRIGESLGYIVGVKTARHRSTADVLHVHDADLLLTFGNPWSEAYRSTVEGRRREAKHVRYARPGSPLGTTIISADDAPHAEAFDFWRISDEELWDKIIN